MKNVWFFIIIISVFLPISFAQEFVKPKEKKIYPSCQQCIELEGDLVTITNKILHKLCIAQKEVITLQENCLDMINGYLEGDKECPLQKSSKNERADLYEKKMKKKKELEKFLQILSDRIDISLLSLNE